MCIDVEVIVDVIIIDGGVAVVVVVAIRISTAEPN